MPSFAFWKSAKQDEAQLSLLNNDAVAKDADKVEPIVPKHLDLNPGNDDSGVFLFDDEDEPKPAEPEIAGFTPTPEATSRILPANQTPVKAIDLQLSPVKQDAVIDLLDSEDLASQSPILCLSPDVSSSTELKTFQTTEIVDSTKLDNDQQQSLVQLPSSPGCASNALTSNITTTTQPSVSEEVVGPNKTTAQPSAMAEETESNTAGQENLIPQSPLVGESTPADWSSVTPNIAALDNMTPSQKSRSVSLTSTDLTRPASVASDSAAVYSNAEDSGVFLLDSEEISSRSRPSSVVSSDDNQSRSRPPSISSRQSSSIRSSPSRQRTGSASSSRNRTDSTSHRLCRPAELNLRSNTAADASKPRSELEKRHDLIRNSKTQSKAALRSPTDLLKDRLNMSPRKVEEKIHIFTPPRPLVNGCLLPNPGAKTEAFTGTSVRARTELGGRPAWWCKFDKLVVFDGIETSGEGELKIHTRTSKGLTIARRRGDMETIIIPMDCEHCQEMLNRHEWKYDMRVCKRNVCWDCKERCKWEVEQEKGATIKNGTESAEQKPDANRYRADSMLQDA